MGVGGEIKRGLRRGFPVPVLPCNCKLVLGLAINLPPPPGHGLLFKFSIHVYRRWQPYCPLATAKKSLKKFE